MLGKDNSKRWNNPDSDTRDLEMGNDRLEPPQKKTLDIFLEHKKGPAVTFQSIARKGWPMQQMKSGKSGVHENLKYRVMNCWRWCDARRYR